MDWTIAILITVIGAWLAINRSTWLVDYAVFVFVFNRGLRRVIDYYINHDFNPLSPISLSPLLVAGMMSLPCLGGLARQPPQVRTVFALLCGAVAYAFLIGFMHVQVAALYALAEALAAIALAGYAVLLNPATKVKDRWIRTFSWSAILASAYGWYQYLTIPPWDAFWLEKVGFIGYMGIPEPTKMSVFSTMAERGPLASFLGFAVVPMIVVPRWRTWLGWPAVLLVFSVILLTTARVGLVVAAISTIVFLLVNRGASRRQVALAATIVGVAAWFGIEQIPNSERIVQRLDTLRNLDDDGSFKDRVQIMSGGLTSLLGSPLGLGLGATGQATRVNTGGAETTVTFGDAGYFQVLLIYGIPGSILLICGLYLGWKRLRALFNIPLCRTEHVLLARALMIAMIPACWVGDMLTGFSIFWLALGCSLAVRPEVLHELRRRINEATGDREVASPDPQVATGVQS